MGFMQWLKARERRGAKVDVAREDTTQLQIQVEVEREKRLFDRIEQLERRHDEAQERHQRERKADREACDEEIRSVRAELSLARSDLGTVATRLRAELHAEDTGQHVLAEIEKRGSRPPKRSGLRLPGPPPLPGDKP